MIKVLNIISDTNIGGAGHVLLNYLKYRDRDKFDVSVLLPENSKLKPYLDELEVPVFETDAIADKSFDFASVKRLKPYIRQIDPDIVHTHGAMSGRIAAHKCGKKVVFTRHSAFPLNPRYTKGFGKLFFKTLNERYADRIIAVSPVCRDDLISGGIRSDMIDVILNGSEPVRRFTQDEIKNAKAEWNIDPDMFLAGIPARLEHYKGHKYILETAKILREKGYKIHILIAGTGTYEDELKKYADKLGVTDSVTFLGFVSETDKFYNILDLQLNASYVEATSMSLIEGMSIGLPAVASDQGGNPMVISDGENGLLFPARDSEAMAKRIMEFFDSPSLQRHLRDGALKIYGNKFTGGIFAGNIEKTYIKTLEAK